MPDPRAATDVPVHTDAHACPVCGAGQTRRLLAWRMTHSIWECRDCGVRFAGKMPEEEYLSDYYDGFLYRKPDAARVRRLIDRRRRELIRMFHLDPAGTGKRFLDYGGGTGVAFQAARELGLRAFLFEIDRQAVEYVRQAYGAEPACLLQPADLEPAGPFDFILADNVIEHVRQPVDLIARLYGLLARGGRLVVKTPQAANTEMYFYPQVFLRGYVREALRHNPIGVVARASCARRYWTCDPPRHLFAFSARSLEETTRRAGVPRDEVAISHYHVPLFEYSLARMLVSKPAGWKGVVRRAAALPLVAAELPLKLVQVVLTGVGLVSAGGVTVTIHKGAPAQPL